MYIHIYAGNMLLGQKSSACDQTAKDSTNTTQTRRRASPKSSLGSIADHLSRPKTRCCHCCLARLWVQKKCRKGEGVKGEREDMHREMQVGKRDVSIFCEARWYVHVHMCIYVHVYDVCMYVYICTCVYIYMYIYNIYTHAYLYIHIYLQVYIYLCACVYVCVCVCMPECIYTYTYMHTLTNTRTRGGGTRSSIALPFKMHIVEMIGGVKRIASTLSRGRQRRPLVDYEHIVNLCVNA